MQKSEAAAYLAGVKQVEGAQASAPTNLHVVTGEVGETSEDGTTTINIDGIVFSESDDQYIEMDTLGGLEEGDIATVILTGEQGHGMTPLAIGAPGSVDRVRDTAVAAGEVASAASAVANATAQHVWIDTNGLHVTEVAQDEWNDSEGASYHSGMNVLINSLGQLFRNADNNLLALVSGTSSSAVAIYDGDGNAASNIVAQFASNLIELGKNSSQAYVDFCGGLGRIGFGAGYIGSFVINGLGHQVVVTGGGSDVMLDSSGGIISTGSDGVMIRSDYVSLVDMDENISETFTMSDFVNAIPVTLYNNASASASASATLSETAANFKRMVIFFKDRDGNYSSTEVWSPNGKQVSLSLTWINGANSQDMYQRVRYVTISGTTISTSKLSGDSKYRTGQVKLNGGTSVTNSDYISIVHVIGYR